jgi:MIP family channel proteins
MYKVQSEASDASEEREMLETPPSDRRDKLRKAFAECLGTMILVLIGDGVVCQTVVSQGLALEAVKNGTATGADVSTQYAGDWTSIALGFGIALMLGIYVSGGVSGGHLNPAVSITMCVFRKLEWSMLPFYITGQMVGAFFGAWFVYLGYRPGILALTAAMGNKFDESTAGIFATYPKPHMTLGEGFVDEVIGSFLLLLGIFAITDKRNNPADNGSKPAIIGMLLTGIALSFGYNTGFALNPARDFGPRLFTLLAGWGFDVFLWGNGYFWVPIFAPVIGGLLGAFVYTRCIEALHPQYVPPPALNKQEADSLA